MWGREGLKGGFQLKGGERNSPTESRVTKMKTAGNMVYPVTAVPVDSFCDCELASGLKIKRRDESGERQTNREREREKE